MIHLGDYPVNSTVYVYFNTFSSVGASVTITNFAVGDIAVYKDGGMTQRASTSGFTLLDTDGIDVDGVTGIHGFSLDLSDNTTAGFWAAGHEYSVVVGPITCDSQTLNFVAATFSIDRWYNQAITRGQVKIAANVANEGALDIRNANAAGHGTLNDGGNTGLYSSGGSIGQYNAGTTDYGIEAMGGLAGQYNLGNGGAGYGQYNAGDAIGQMNAGSGLASIGQLNEGIVDGQKNDGGTRGQYSVGGTYGQLNAGGTDGINATGTINAGIQATGGADGLLATGAAGYGGNFSGGTAALNPALAVTGDAMTLAVGAITAGVIDTGAIDADAIAADAIGASELAATAVNEIADQVWDELIAGHLGLGSTGAALNAVGGGATVFPTGAINFTYTVTDSVTTLPIEGVEVWFSTDNPAVNIVWKGDTDAFGVARDVLGNLPALDPGTYYIWRQKAGYTFADPDTEIVS